MPQRRGPVNRRNAKPIAPRRTRAVARRRMGGTRQRGTAAGQMGRAKSSLRRFRKASLLTVALTSLLLMFVGDEAQSDESATASPVEEQASSDQEPEPKAEKVPKNRPRVDDVAGAVGSEAEGALDRFTDGVISSLPKLAVVFLLLLAAWIVSRLIRVLLHKTLGQWPKSSAAAALSGLAIWMLAIGLSMSVIVGDVRAFVGSVGLLGLALSWALQVPIESFTGWLLNAFKGYYRVGDRVEVGEVFGDVYRIDVLTTTVWEIGSPFRDSFVRAEQPTGRLITFPNNQILTGSVMNFTRDFEFVWDELGVTVGNESDMRHGLGVLETVANRILGATMVQAAEKYERILRRAGLVESVAPAPQVFISLEDSWTKLTIRYLVAARQRRRWKSDLVLAVNEELAKPEHKTRIIPVVPRHQVQLIGVDGIAREPSEVASQANR